MVICRVPPTSWIMVLCMLALAIGEAHAQPRAVVEPVAPQVYDTVTFTIRHNGALQVSQAHPPASDNLRAVHRIRQESSFSSVTGRTESVSWQYDAMEPGDFSIGPLNVMADGVRVTIPEVKGTVRSVEAQPTGLPSDIDGRAGHPLPLASGDRALARSLRGKAFIVTEVPSDLLVGWPFRANTYFYLATSVTNAEPRSISPKPAGGQQFITIPELSTPHSGSAVQTVTINGQAFRRYHVHTTTVVPTRAGKAQFKGGEMGIDFLHVGRTSMRSILTTIAFETPVQEVEIRGLPPAPPEAHLQVVGNHTISTFVDRKALSQGDLVTLTIRLSGNGYLELASMGKLPEIDGLIFVREEVASQISLTPGNEYAATKMFRRVYQAEESGLLTIPPIVMANFNPKTNEQDLRRSDPITLTIASSPTGTQVLGGAGNALPKQADAMEIGAGGILHIDTSPLRLKGGGVGVGGALFGSTWFWTLHAAILLIVASVAGMIAFRRLSDGESDSRRAASRRSQVASALREAERLRGSSEAEPFYLALQRGMMGQLGRVLGREPGGLTLEDGLKGLRNLGAPESMLDQLGRLLEHCESIRYATGSMADSRDRDLERARSLVRELERLRR